MKNFKRKYEPKLIHRAVSVKENRNFLITHLRKEWEEIEARIKKDKHKQQLYNTAKETGKTLGLLILAATALCGILVVGAVAPNVFAAFGHSGRHRRYFSQDNFKNQAAYLKRRGYIRIVKKKEDGFMEIVLTNRGRRQVFQRTLRELKIALQEKWDGIWRIVVFDIPEKDKWAREGIRERLKRMGFYQLQKSTFVFPYPCREEVAFLGGLYGAQDYLRFIESNSVNFDDDMKEFFSLPRS